MLLQPHVWALLVIATRHGACIPVGRVGVVVDGTVTNALARRAADPRSWISATFDELRAQLSLREACMAPQALAHDGVCRAARSDRNASISPLSGGRVKVTSVCEVNRQQGHAMPRVRDDERALYERMDLGDLTEGEPEARSMFHFLNSALRDGRESILFVGDSVVENTFLALCCNALREAPSAEFAAAIGPQNFDMRRQARSPEVTIDEGVGGRGPRSAFFDQLSTSTLPMGSDKNGEPRFIKISYARLRCIDFVHEQLANSRALLALLVKVIGPRGLVVANFGPHLHTVSDFTGPRFIGDEGSACAGTVRPWLHALGSYARAGGVSFWIDNVAQHFGALGSFESWRRQHDDPSDVRVHCWELDASTWELPGDTALAGQYATNKSLVRTDLNGVLVGANFKNLLVRALVPPSDRAHIHFLPWFHISSTRTSLHPGGLKTRKPSAMDCTHLAFTPFLYEPLVVALNLRLQVAIRSAGTQQ